MIFLCYHTPELLAACPAPPGTERILLPKLDLPYKYAANCYAESRFLLYLALNPQLLPLEGPVGIFQASYPTKFPALPSLEALPTWIAEPEVLRHECYGPVCATNWLAQSDVHMGMSWALERVFTRGRVPIRQRPGPMCNSFYTDAGVLRRLLPLWLRLFVLSVDELDSRPWVDPPSEWCTDCVKPGLGEAYFLERLTSGILASFEDVATYTIYGETTDHVYAPKLPVRPAATNYQVWRHLQS